MAEKKIECEVDAETWAESGGTAGMFGKYWKRGTLRIIGYEEHMERTNGTLDKIVIINGKEV